MGPNNAHLTTPKEDNIPQGPKKADEADVNNDPESHAEKEKDHGNTVEAERNETQDGAWKRCACRLVRAMARCSYWVGVRGQMYSTS